MNEEIFGGLKTAVERGETLQQVMMSFYNAGYKKEDIEESARALQVQIMQKKGGVPIKTSQEKEMSKQVVSKYEQKPSGSAIKKSQKILLIFLFFILFILLGGLSILLIFKDESISFLKNLFN